MVTVTLNYDNLPDGELVEVLYLGVFPNGQTTEVPEAQVLAYQNITGKTIKGNLTLPDDDVVPLEEDPVVPEPTEPAVDLTLEGDDL